MDSATRMTALAMTFPAIRKKAPAGVAPWDPETLVQAMQGSTGSEWLVVTFLLTIWNTDCPSHFDLPPFNVVEAYQRWDRDNWQAFADWAAKPFSC